MANTAGFVTGTGGVTPQAFSTRDRRELGMRLRKQGGGKSNKDKVVEAAKALQDEDFRA